METTTNYEAKFLDALTHEIRRTIPNITKDELTFNPQTPRLSDLPKSEARTKILDMLEEIFAVYFGKNIYQLFGKSESAKSTSIKFINNLIDSILERFGALTVEDLGFSFKRAEIEQNPYQALTVQSICKYIQYWYGLKITIWRAKNTVQATFKEEEEGRARLKLFKQKCLKIYRDSMDSGEWQGDLFEANFLAQFIRPEIPEDEIEVMKMTAKRQRTEIVARSEQAAKRRTETTMQDNATAILDVFSGTTDRLLSKLVVEWGIINGFEI